MNNQVNLLNPYQNVQYPVNYALNQINPIQVAEYAVAANNTSNDNVKMTDGIGLMSVFSLGKGAIDTTKYAKNTGKTLNNLIEETKTAVHADVEALKEASKSADFSKSINKVIDKNKISQDIIKAQTAMPSAAKMAKMTPEVREIYEQANEQLKKASEYVTRKAKQNALNKAEDLLKQVKGNSLNTAKTATNTAKAATKGAALLKAVKGNAVFASIEGGVELFTNVIPTFKENGTKSGVKQIGKSTAKVAASVGGWAAGAAIGSAIGSVIPGAGTAVGAVVGGLISTVSSLVCSTAATKLTEKIVGKDELALKEIQNKKEKTATKTQTQTQTKPQVAANQVTNTQIAQNYPLYNNPFINQYITNDSADNLLTMPVRGYQPVVA